MLQQERLGHTLQRKPYKNMKSELILATSKYVRTTTKKAGPVMTLIRGKSYLEAERILTFTRSKAAKLVLKTLKSAGANATNNNSKKEDALYVLKAEVGAGPTQKRGRIVAIVSPISFRFHSDLSFAVV